MLYGALTSFVFCFSRGGIAQNVSGKVTACGRRQNFIKTKGVLSCGAGSDSGKGVRAPSGVADSVLHEHSVRAGRSLLNHSCLQAVLLEGQGCSRGPEKVTKEAPSCQAPCTLTWAVANCDSTRHHPAPSTTVRDGMALAPLRLCVPRTPPGYLGGDRGTQDG